MPGSSSPRSNESPIGMRISAITAAATLAWQAIAAPFASATTSMQRAAAVKSAFEFAWDGYAQKCFGLDEVSPVSGTCHNPR